MNLNELNYKDKIILDLNVEIPKTYYESSQILELDTVHVQGQITLNSYNAYEIKALIKGIMFLEDCVSLEKKSYEYMIELDEEISENLINSKNMLDINELLWQNIVLEVPIRFTEEDADNMEGENWKVIDENAQEEKIDPRMQKLYDLYKGGE